MDAARLWRRHVEGARAVADSADRYFEVRYEDLRSSPEEAFGTILDWLRVDHDASFRLQALEACGIAKLRKV